MNENLISNFEYRPSLTSEINDRIIKLSSKEKDSLHSLIHDSTSINQINNPNIMSPYLRVLKLHKLQRKNLSSDEIFQKATNKLAQIPHPTYQFSSANYSLNNPLVAHDTSAMKYTLVQNQNSKSIKIGYRPALHEFNDYHRGYLDNTQLIILSPELRLEFNDKLKIKLNELTFFDIKSYPVADNINNNLSWSFNFKYYSTLVNDCFSCNQLATSFTIGLTKQIAKNFNFYLLGGSFFSFFSHDKLTTQMGPRFELGFKINYFEKTLLWIESNFDYIIINKYTSFYYLLKNKAALVQYLSKNENLAFSFTNLNNHLISNEFALSFTHHF